MLSYFNRIRMALSLLGVCWASVAAAEKPPKARILAVPEVAKVLKVKQGTLSLVDGQEFALLGRFDVEVESAEVDLKSKDLPVNGQPDLLLEIGQPTYEAIQSALPRNGPGSTYQLSATIQFRVRIPAAKESKRNFSFWQFAHHATEDPNEEAKQLALKKCLKELVQGLGHFLGQEMVSELNLQGQKNQLSVSVRLKNVHTWVVHGRLEFPKGDYVVQPASRDFTVSSGKEISLDFRLTPNPGERKRPTVDWWEKPYWRSKRRIVFPDFVLNPMAQKK